MSGSARPDDGDDDGLDRWRIDAPMTVALRETVAGLASFPAAARLLTVNMLSLRRFSAATDGMFRDAGHYVAAMLAIYLHSSGGLTMPRLREFCRRTGYLSPGRARAMLIYMQYLRFVEILPTRHGQSTRYRPTERFVTAWRRHLRLAIEATVPIAPGVERLLARFDEDAAFECFATLHCETLMAAAVEENRCPKIEKVFLHRIAGTYILHILAGAGREAEQDEHGIVFPPRAPAPLSMAGLAREYGVSRLHLRRMFDDAEAEGLIERSAEGGVGLLPPLRGEIVANYASQLFCLLVAATQTLARLEIGLGTIAA